MALLAMLSWPILALLIFARLPALTALIWSVLLPYLYLPEAFKIDLPGLPDINKTAVISLGLAMGLFMFRPKVLSVLEASRPVLTGPRLRALLWLCALGVFAGLFLTVMNNRAPIAFEEFVLPAARPWDALSNVVQWGLILLPFWMAMRFLSDPERHRALLTALVVAAVGYSFLMLVEIRLSPQLHNWVYGYYQHSFAQHVRGGYRPMVFMSHGLWVGFFIFTGLIAAIGLWKSTWDAKWLWAATGLLIILLLSRNLAAVGIAFMVLFALFACGQKLQRWFLCFVALSVLFYPVLRQGHVVPIDGIVATAEALSPARAQSLEFRLRNEDALLERAWEKKWTGWSGWGRERVYTERGRVETIADGLWIITIGQRGWIGYLSLFGILTLPLIWLSVSRRIHDIPPQTMALCMIVAGNLIYMIPNATMTPVGLLVFGALAGFVVYGTKKSDTSQPSEPQHRTRRHVQYTRSPGQRQSPLLRPEKP